MALVHKFTVNDVEYPAAYSRVLFVRFDKTDAYIFVNTYADESARQREDAPVYQNEYRADLSTSANTVFPAAYEYLKTQPEFTGAVDC